MDTRKIQKSGSTFYVYLPTSWCRKNNITTDTTVDLKSNTSGDLVIGIKKHKQKPISLNYNLDDNSPETINKMLVATYINPVQNFEIRLKNSLSPQQILAHKKLLGGLDLVEFEEKKILCRSTVNVDEPDLMLKGMIRKITNIIKLLKREESQELIERYEEEIDRSNILITKSIIAFLMHQKTSKLKDIDLFYISRLSKNLEGIADNIIKLDKFEPVLDNISFVMEELDSILDSISMENAILFLKIVSKIKDQEANFYLKRMVDLANNIAKTISDWAITKEIDP